MAEAVIRTEGLSRRFDAAVAVDGLTLRVDRGEVFGLLGPNGGGKTTTVRMLCCLLAPTFGRAEVLGIDVARPEGNEEIRQRVGFLPESPGLYERLSAYRNLDFHARLYGVPPERRAERIESLLKRLDVWDRRDDAIATFSRGMRQKIALARSVVHEPEIVFLDEPTANLDPEAAITVREMILELRREGRTVFLNTHNLDEAGRICDRVAVLKTRLRAIGAPGELGRQRFGRWTRIELSAPSPQVERVLAASAHPLGFRSDGTHLSVQVDDPTSDNPRLAAEVLRAGGQLVSIGEEHHGLEELYLSLLEGG
ncbi:MAG: ABC transporter ATP-binding protein [Thermoplasmata archaeon]|nr:ABC transporter ATP-binding protein [Thermoplasmata archaeon]